MTFSFSRREFLKVIAGSMCSTTIASEGLGHSGILGYMGGSEARADELPLKESMYYKKLENLRIECEICPRKCKVADLERGYCGNKENRDGKYYTLVYSRPCSVHVDPIEKKPLFHYLPGTPALSIATAGCNIECKFCQNWQISQFRPEQVRNFDLPPEEIVRLAREHKAPTIAYTYSEPVVFYTYMYDTAKLAKQEGIGSVMISNGYITEEPLVELCKELSAVKVDLKAFTEKFYKEICSGELKPVLEGLETLKKIGIWYEIVVLIVPTLNDGGQEIREMSMWIIPSISPDSTPPTRSRTFRVPQ
jgi:pyruvate formate lyase activating enzyme